MGTEVDDGDEEEDMSEEELADEVGVDTSWDWESMRRDCNFAK